MSLILHPHKSLTDLETFLAGVRLRETHNQITRERSKELHLNPTLLCSFFWFSHGCKLITLCILHATHLVSLRGSPHRRCRRGCLGWLINRQRSKGLHLSRTLLCSFFWFSHVHKLITLCILQATHLVYLRASTHRRCRRGCLGWLINRQRSKGLHLSRTLLCSFFWFSHVHKLITLCILQATHLVYLRASTHRRCRRGLWVGWLILRCK